MQDSGTGPRLGFGCVSLGSVTGGRSWQSDVRLVQEAIDRGVTLFDTADAYAGGVSELIVGRAAKGRRTNIEIATKAGYLFRERSLIGHSLRRAALPAVRFVRRVESRRSPATSARAEGHTSFTRPYDRQDFSAEHIRAAVDASLRRLGTDYIDVFQLHGPPGLLPDIANDIRTLIADGKVRRFGIGAESVAVAREWLAADEVSVLQAPFGVLDPGAADQLFEPARARGVELWARGVFGGGVLSVGAAPMTDSAKATLIRELTEIARRAEVSLYKLAIDYVRSFGSVSTILLGIHSSEHLATNVRLLEGNSVETTVIDEVKAAVARRAPSNGGI